MNKNRYILLSLFILFSFASIFGLDIPLSGGSSSVNSSAKIGFVDMDRIFRIFPQTQAAKEDYATQLKKKKDQMALKEKELEDIKNRMAILESTLNSVQTDEAGEEESMPNSVPNLKKELEGKRTEFEDLKKRAAQDLATFQSQQSQIILGKIYQALRDLALEEQVSVVVDKSSILYGDATIDLTDKLQTRVRGY